MFLIPKLAFFCLPPLQFSTVGTVQVNAMRLWLGKVFATYSFVLVVRAASATTVLPPECTVYRTHTVSLSPSSVTTSYYETAPTYIDGTLAFQSTITETTYHTVPTTTLGPS